MTFMGGRWSKLRIAGYLVLAMLAGYLLALRFVMPKDALPGPEAPSGITASTAHQASSKPAVLYRNCDEARAAGAAPIFRGEPGYAAALDPDNDGVACEPYYGPVKNFGRTTYERHKGRHASSP